MSEKEVGFFGMLGAALPSSFMGLASISLRASNGAFLPFDRRGAKDALSPGFKADLALCRFFAPFSEIAWPFFSRSGKSPSMWARDALP